MQIFKRKLELLIFGGLLMMSITGCATLAVTDRKALSPATGKQPVTLGIIANGERLVQNLDNRQQSLLAAANGTLFDKVMMLPPAARHQLPAEVLAAHGTDYLLTMGISDISVNGGLNPIWFASFPLLFFKVYAPIVTFQPTVSLDMMLQDARTGAFLAKRQITEVSSDHFSPANPSDKVRGLVDLTINNALVSMLQESQQSIAAARQQK